MGGKHTHIRQISAYHHTKEDGSKEELSNLQDNLYYQVKKKYQYMFKEGLKTLCWYYHPEYTDDLYPPDAGSVNHIRLWFVVYLDEWLWDYGNVELWYLYLISSPTR